MEKIILTEYDKKIWQEELAPFLPQKIFDIHTHVYLKKNMPPLPEGTVRKVTWAGAVAEENPIEDLKYVYDTIFPGKDVKALMFCGGSRGFDKNNEYVKTVSQNTLWPALYYSMPYQSADEVEQKIREGGFLGIKSYLSRAPKYIPTKEVRIYDFFPPHQLERLNEMGAIVMCHVPRDGRLKDPVNLHQIVEIRQKYPKLRFIVAHIGRAYTKDDVGDAFDMLDTIPGTMYDFSANSCEYVITEAIKHAGTKCLMFGTDMPILRMRAHRIDQNGTYINIVPSGMYEEAKNDPHLRYATEEEEKTITFLAYEELLAFKRACISLNLTKQDVEDMMYNNAQRLTDGARQDIYGK